MTLLPVNPLEWARIAAAAALAALLTAPLAYCEGKQAERSRNAAARAEANVQAMKTNQKATDSAAAQRVTDATTVAAHEEELIDAIQTVPDTNPDAVRVALGCQRLRDQGTDTANLPACAGLGR